MISLELFQECIQSQFGTLPIAEDDEITRKLAMLIEGECGSEGIDRTAAKFGYSRQRYFQVRTLFLEKGGQALLSSKRGPKSNYRRTQELVSQVIRHRFLDPEASTEVIAQKLRQCNFSRAEDVVFSYSPVTPQTELLVDEYVKGRMFWSDVVYTLMPEYKQSIRVGSFDIPVIDVSPNPLLREAARWMKKQA